MAVIINDRDKLLQAAPVRITRVPIEISDVNGLQNALNAVKSVTITASAQNFVRNINNPSGPTNPATISLTAKLAGLTGVVSWSVVSGTLTLNPTSNVCNITGTTMTTATAVVRATLVSGGEVYNAEIVINRLGAVAGNDNIPANVVTAGTFAAGVIYAGDISATQVTAGSFSGKEFTGGTFTGGLFRTVASGARVEVRGSDSSLRVYNASGQETATLAPNIGVNRFQSHSGQDALEVTNGGGGAALKGSSQSGYGLNVSSVSNHGIYSWSSGGTNYAGIYGDGIGSTHGIYARSNLGFAAVLESVNGIPLLMLPTSNLGVVRAGGVSMHPTHGLIISNGSQWLKPSSGWVPV